MLKPLKNKPIIFAVSHCLFNPKVRAKGLPQHPETKEKILKLAEKYNAKIEKLPCPEFLFLGEREPKTYDEYIQIAGFKEFCEKLVQDFTGKLKKYKDSHVFVIGIARSPSCSISYVYDKDNNLKKGEGLFMHFLLEKIADNVAFAEADYRNIDASIEQLEKVIETAL